METWRAAPGTMSYYQILSVTIRYCLLEFVCCVRYSTIITWRTAPSTISYYQLLSDTISYYQILFIGIRMLC